MTAGNNKAHFCSNVEYELEKRVEKMETFPDDLGLGISTNGALLK